MSPNLSSNIKKGFFWNSISQFTQQGISLLSMIILGRLLNPEDFGFLGMFAIFIAIASLIVDSGMGGALFKKSNATIVDYSTLFFYNLTISLILYTILYFLAPVIATFYDNPTLISLIRVVGVIIIIRAISIIQDTRILKELKFKAYAIINCLSGLISLIIAIILAKNGYGVWVLVVQQLSVATITTLLLLLYNKFIPSFIFSISSFKEQFSFGINLLFAQLLKITTNNITSNIMAKTTSLAQTGYFVQSNKLIEVANQSITSIIDKTVFPIFSKMKDISEMKIEFVNLSKNIYSILFPVSVLMSLLSQQIITILLGEKWKESIWIFQILSFSLIPLYIQMLCRNILKSRAKTKQIFINEVVKSILFILSLTIGIILGVKYIIWGIVVVQTIVSMYIMYTVSKEINYAYRQQLKDVLILISISILSYLCSKFIYTTISCNNHFLNILLGISLIIIFVLTISYFLKQKEIFNIIKIVPKLLKTIIFKR